MRRLILSLFAAATLLGPLAAVGDASARDKPGRAERGERGDRGDRGRDRGPPAWSRGEGPGRGWRAEDRPSRREWRAPPRSAYGPPPGYEGRRAPRNYEMRRGGYLPPEVDGSAVYDYGRYHLRPPPRGYTWLRVGDAIMLVGPDGRIFDMIR